MIIGERLRTVREQRGLSQAQIEQRTGLLQSYISRVENGHTIPAVETLEKLPAPLKFRSTDSSTTAMNHPRFQIFQNA